MSHVTMEMSHRGSHLHNGLSSYSHHHGGVMGHMGLGSAGERVSSSHQHVACSPADDVDLDALINDMNTFPAYNEERPLLESMENLSHLQDSSSYEFCSKSASQSALNVGRTIPKPKLDWTWRSKSTSGTPVVEHAKLKLSTSLPERREQKEVAGDDEVPNPFPGLKTMGVGSAVENLYIAQKSKDKLSLTNGDQSEVPQASTNCLKQYSTPIIDACIDHLRGTSHQHMDSIGKTFSTGPCVFLGPLHALGTSRT